MFGAKFGVGPNPIAAEPSKKEIAPNKGQLRAAYDAYLKQIAADTGNEILKKQISKHVAKKHIEKQNDQVKSDFQHRFDAFLLGRMDPDDESKNGMPFTRTPGWGNRYTSLMNNAEVRKYVNDKTEARAEFDRYLNVMKHLGTAVGYDPTTGAYWAPGLEEWYIYFKYVLEESNEDFLGDWSMYREKINETRARTKTDRIAEAGYVFREDSDGNPMNVNVMPVGDANPGHFGPGERDGYWLTKKEAAMINRAAERDASDFHDPVVRTVPGTFGIGSTPVIDSKSAVKADTEEEERLKKVRGGYLGTISNSDLKALEADKLVNPNDIRAIKAINFANEKYVPPKGNLDKRVEESYNNYVTWKKHIPAAIERIKAQNFSIAEEGKIIHALQVREQEYKATVDENITEVFLGELNKAVDDARRELDVIERAYKKKRADLQTTIKKNPKPAPDSAVQKGIDATRAEIAGLEAARQKLRDEMDKLNTDIGNYTPRGNLWTGVATKSKLSPESIRRRLAKYKLDTSYY